MEREQARWAVVLDDADSLRGWIAAERAAGEGTVRDRAVRMEAWVNHDASLKDALSTMLQ